MYTVKPYGGIPESAGATGTVSEAVMPPIHLPNSHHSLLYIAVYFCRHLMPQH